MSCLFKVKSSEESDCDSWEITPNTSSVRGNNSGTASDEYEADDESYGKLYSL